MEKQWSMELLAKAYKESTNLTTVPRWPARVRTSAHVARAPAKAAVHGGLSRYPMTRIAHYEWHSALFGMDQSDFMSPRATDHDEGEAMAKKDIPYDQK